MTRRWVILCFVAALSGCGREEKPAASSPAPAAAPAVKPADLPPLDTRPVIVAFGDSLTAGHGLEPGQSYADHLQKQLDYMGYRYRVVNQGISGDTTDGGVSRLDAAVTLRPRVVILELGANDGLRGLPLQRTQANLDLIISTFQGAGAKVILCGMTLPRNYGPDYIRDFEKMFKDLAQKRKTVLIPFFLDGVATKRELMQPDGLHPTAEGTKRVAANVMKHLEPVLSDLGK